MAAPPDTFLIDATGFFAANHKAYLGAPILVVDGEDHTFIFGVMRDLLELRQNLGIQKGAVVVGQEAYQVTTAASVENVIALLKHLGIAVVNHPRCGVLELCRGLASLATYIVTHDRRLLLLATNGRRIVVLQEEEPMVVGAETVLSVTGVTGDELPTFLALTDGPGPTVLTKREALIVLQRPGELADKIANPLLFSSRRIRKVLGANQAVFRQRIEELSPKESGRCPDVDRKKLKMNIAGQRNSQLLAKHGFRSLSRLLPRPRTVHSLQEPRKENSQAYHAIVTPHELVSLAKQMETSAYCAVDTESSGKDPHTAELFGVSLSVRKGEAFYIPTVEHGLGRIDRDAAFSMLRMALEGSIKVVGHNLKYDYVLLRRNGIKIANIEFDTMLAAYDCFGDSDLLNLQYLAKRLLGRNIRAHKDVLCAGQNLLDIPFRTVVEYSCEHAEVTLQLRKVLQRQLSQRCIEQQYRNDTLPLAKRLGDWECEGIRVDCGKLRRIRNSLANDASGAKSAVVVEVGSRIDLDSAKEVAAALRLDPVVANVIGFRKLSPRLLAELAVAHKAARLLVRYSRSKERLRAVEAVIESAQGGRVHPVFSQTRTDYCRLVSVKPRLLDFGCNGDIGPCLPDELRQFCPDTSSALGILAEVAADTVLQGDLLAAKKFRCFGYLTPLNDGDHFQLLLSVIVGHSDDQMSSRMLKKAC